MKINLILYILLLCSAFAKSQTLDEYSDFSKSMYVYDSKDIYVNVRKEPNSSSTIVDSLFQLQIVKVSDNPKNGWYRSEKGYIHQSRLQELPSYIVDALRAEKDSDFCFIASPSCPQILIFPSFVQLSQLRIVEDITSWADIEGRYITYRKLIINSMEGHQVLYVNPKGESTIIAETNPIAPLEAIIISQNNVELVGNIYNYSYAYNRNNELCQYTLFHNKQTLVNIEKQKIILDKFDKMLEIIASYTNIDDKQNITPQLSSEMEKKLLKVIELNDFVYWSDLEKVYISGVSSKLNKYYYQILRYYPIDGEGTHAIEPYFNLYSAFRYRGEVRIEDIDSVSW